MHPIDFKECNAVFAKDQPQYRPLPAHRHSTGRITTCWRLSFVERLRVLATGKIWWQQLTFGQPLQAQLGSTVKPELSEGA